MMKTCKPISQMDRRANHRIDQGTIWSGYHNTNMQVYTTPLSASIYSGAAYGRKGGDLYFLSVCRETQFSHIVIGDVAGHGETVSQISSWLLDALCNRINRYGDHQVFEELNKLTIQKGLDALTTMASLVYSAPDRLMQVCYAGHPPIFVMRHDTQHWETIHMQTRQGPNNIPLGVSENAQFDSKFIALNPGDQVLLYTDGVIEALNEQQQYFGEERLMLLLNSLGAQEPQVIKQEVLDNLNTYSGHEMDHDDVTLIVLSIH